MATYHSSYDYILNNLKDLEFWNHIVPGWYTYQFLVKCLPSTIIKHHHILINKSIIAPKLLTQGWNFSHEHKMNVAECKITKEEHI